MDVPGEPLPDKPLTSAYALYVRTTSIKPLSCSGGFMPPSVPRFLAYVRPAFSPSKALRRRETVHQLNFKRDPSSLPNLYGSLTAPVLECLASVVPL